MHCSQDGEGIAVTCASSPLVPSNVGIVVCVNLAVLRGADVQAAVLLDGDLMREALVRHTVNQAEGSGRTKRQTTTHTGHSQFRPGMGKPLFNPTHQT